MTAIISGGGMIRDSSEKVGASRPPLADLEGVGQTIGGVDTQAVHDLGHMARVLVEAVGAPDDTRRWVGKVPKILRLVPFIEAAQTDGVTDENVSRYRADILAAAGRSKAEKAARVAEIIGWRTPGQHVERSIMQAITGQNAAVLLQDARQKFEAAADEVDFVAGFENPRQQFLDEIGTVATKVADAIEAEQRTRLQNGGLRTAAPDDTPPGLKGVLTKIIRKVKRFFGFFRRHKAGVDPEITAYDAAGGLQKTFETMLSDELSLQRDTPMLKRYLFDKLPSDQSGKRWQLAMAAPELLQFIFSTAPDDPRHRRLADQVRRHPHELYFATKYVRKFQVNTASKRWQLDIDQLRMVAAGLLPSVSQVLPTNGQAVRDTYNHVSTLLEMLRYTPKNNDRDIRIEETGMTGKPDEVDKIDDDSDAENPSKTKTARSTKARQKPIAVVQALWTVARRRTTKYKSAKLER